MVVLSFLFTFVASLALVTQQGLADRGTDPAVGSTVGLQSGYVVQSGDTLWSIAQRLRPGNGLAEYVDALVAMNGGPTLTVGELLRLP